MNRLGSIRLVCTLRTKGNIAGKPDGDWETRAESYRTMEKDYEAIGLYPSPSPSPSPSSYLSQAELARLGLLLGLGSGVERFDKYSINQWPDTNE
ncbi:hypothetical protein U1Q18_011539 [Sarracenia purpurea var. burkii]